MKNFSLSDIFRRIILLATLAFTTFLSVGQTKQSLPPWKKGELDIYQISYGLGNSCYIILPDGTTLLIDAGAINENYPREIHPIALPNSNKSAGTHIVSFIKSVMPKVNHQIDYALITHFHDDHMGFPGKYNALSANGTYRLTGITEVGESIQIKKLLDRGWPDYNYPQKLDNEMVDNYRKFIAYKQETTGLKMEKFRPGVKNQIKLLRDYKKYNSTFSIRNIVGNGLLWTGDGTKVRSLFPDSIPAKYTNQLFENACSNAIKIKYGGFNYFNGGDIEGIVMPGVPEWLDVETPVSKVLGKIDVAVMDHHGYKNSENDVFLSIAKPKVYIVPAWASVHPDSVVLKRVIADNAYTNPPYVFSTSLLKENKEMNKDLWPKVTSKEGHILIRVEPGGKVFNVFVLDDHDESHLVKAKYGPFFCR
jgi:beta-lactamase superfamily II metal-dependent hydrolase